MFFLHYFTTVCNFLFSWPTLFLSIIWTLHQGPCVSLSSVASVQTWSRFAACLHQIFTENTPILSWTQIQRGNTSLLKPHGLVAHLTLKSPYPNSDSNPRARVRRLACLLIYSECQVKFQKREGVKQCAEQEKVIWPGPSSLDLNVSLL